MDIRAIGIVKAFGDDAAIRGIDLDVGSGELVALLGPSGSGKTTLLRVIAGLEAPDAGQIRFGDEDATGVPVRHRGVGFVFQHYALFRHLTVFDNVAFGLRARGRRRPPGAEIARRVRELIALVQLDGLEGRFPAQLSGGQRQRVALARALAVEPRVLLLDEPFGALDARVRKDLRRSLREIHDATGQTTIFVTHDQDEALELADRVAILNRGRLEQVGTPDEIHDAPASAFVMGFVGESSRLAVEIVGREVLFRGRVLSLSPGGVPDGAADLFLRPGDAAFTDDPAGWPGRVATIRRSAGGRRAEVRLDGVGQDLVGQGLVGQGLVGDDIVTVEVPVDRTVSRGEALRVAVTGGRVFATSQSTLLRPQSGRGPIPE